MFTRSVVASTMSQVRVERAPRGEPSSDRVAVIAQFSQDRRISRSLNTMIAEFLGSGYRVIISSSCQSSEELVFDEAVRDEITVLRRPNVGYDFGSWTCGLAWDPDISRAGNVVFMNDSMVGPFVPLDTVLTRFEESGADVYGLTDTTQFVYHLQSYFLGFRNGVLEEKPLRRFWMGVRHETTKQETIQRNEIGFSRLLRREGYGTDAAFAHRRSAKPGENPTIRGWEKLLELGFPFVKREIIRTPGVAPRGDQVAAVVRRKFGVDIEEWL
jgi:lipopolysaccharide biosynthesis protein